MPVSFVSLHDRASSRTPSEPSPLLMARWAAALHVHDPSEAPPPPSAPWTGEDWADLATLAAPHGVAGLIYWNATRSSCLSPLWDTCPSAVQSSLRDHYYRNLARNLYWRKELSRIAAVFLANGLRPIVLRGLTFMGTLYPDDGMRSSDDCDLCVRPVDHAKTEDLLRRLGYEACQGGAHVYSNGRGFLDLHTGFGDEDRLRNSTRLHQIGAEQVWAEARPFSTSAGELLQLSPRDSLLLNALHLLKHEYSRLIWKFDLVQLMLDLTARAEWPSVVERAEAFRLTLPLACAVAYAEGLLPHRLNGLLESVHHTLPDGVATRLFRWLRQDEDLGGLSFLIMAWMTPHVSDRMRFLAEALVPRPDVRAGMHAEWEGHATPRTLLADRCAKLARTVRTLAALATGVKR